MGGVNLTRHKGASRWGRSQFPHLPKFSSTGGDMENREMDEFHLFGMRVRDVHLWSESYNEEQPGPPKSSSIFSLTRGGARLWSTG